MSNITESIDVDVPVSTAYNQWTQFESFPQFMEGVESIEQVTDTRSRWTVEVGGATRTFVTEISEQTPDQRVAWTTVEGDIGHSGVVSFHHLDDNLTRVTLDMEVEPEGFIEKVGDKLGFVSRRAKGDMQRFKEFIEAQGHETGAWRGEVERD
ncbi:MAG: SRPBCC family protein [Acidimicrobiia bacterium]|nr:SRPBCC family protein [Acidimicrobiia bacterium]